MYTQTLESSPDVLMTVTQAKCPATSHILPNGGRRELLHNSVTLQGWVEC